VSAGEVVVLSPSPRSLYTLEVVERLRAADIAVHGVCARRLLSTARLREEYRREGSRLLRKVWKKLLWRTSRGSEASRAQARGSLRTLARRHGIPLVFGRDFEDEAVVGFLESVKPELVVFTGGGILRRGVLERAGRGVVNCHLGILPTYRGMDAALWALLEARPERIGLSVHLMDEGIDTGPLLSVRPVALERNDTSPAQLLERLESLMGETIVEASVRFLRGELAPRPQKPEDGRQYFRMHPRLREIAGRKLGAYARSLGG
jgi:folate-dependent phosphoribosylglycinamide formyltransferase PurN